MTSPSEDATPSGNKRHGDEQVTMIPASHDKCMDNTEDDKKHTAGSSNTVAVPTLHRAVLCCATDDNKNFVTVSW